MKTASISPTAVVLACVVLILLIFRYDLSAHAVGAESAMDFSGAADVTRSVEDLTSVGRESSNSCASAADSDDLWLRSLTDDGGAFNEITTLQIQANVDRGWLCTAGRRS